MFPRDEDAVRMITDGRWLYPPDPPPWKIGPRLAAPLALRRDARSGLTALVMAPAEDCFAVSTPYGQDDHRSLYLSLLGRDLKAGHTASARAAGHRQDGLRPAGGRSLPGVCPLTGGRHFLPSTAWPSSRLPPSPIGEGFDASIGGWTRLLQLLYNSARTVTSPQAGTSVDRA